MLKEHIKSQALKSRKMTESGLPVLKHYHPIFNYMIIYCCSTDSFLRTGNSFLMNNYPIFCFLSPCCVMCGLRLYLLHTI